MALADRLFPAQKRDFPGKRWVKILLRTVHLMGLAGIGGAYFYSVDASQWLPFLWVTMVSGLLMLIVEVWSHGVWLLQVRGLAIFVKILLLSFSALLPQSMDPVLIMIVILISGIVSHAPGRLRYYSPFYRRRITPDTWQWQGDRSPE
ncbi:hypothetical protein [Motiliproteus sp. MSK22-1]|uniref:hypothetical protein n=1 Tax=Motiliproteus sp. MSK22-1 TaxID=1897630 RepID=UPI0009762A4C|nr:hypothetical protein [Motiliproteus sp. MSK22-1]OMH38296.1 hypothetical protein BGP75_08615 [Motiliproteus sp. MSK22-1]